MNLKEFNQIVTDAGRAMPRELVEQMHRKFAMDGLRFLVFRTPVRLGYARGGWQVTFGQPARGQVDVADRSGGATVSVGSSVAAKAPAYSVTWITNNVHYIVDLEDGSSQQAPEGMLSLTLDDLVSPFA